MDPGRKRAPTWRPATPGRDSRSPAAGDSRLLFDAVKLLLDGGSDSGCAPPVAFALGCSAGLMVISQLVPFAKSVGIAAAALSTMTLVVGAFGNASGRILSGWMSDKLGRINVLRVMIGISMVALPELYAAGGNLVLLYLAVFVVYWCYGTQLSVNGVATSDFWGTKNAGINYGMLFTAWGVAGILGPRIGGTLFDKYHNYQAAFYTAAALAAVALLCEMFAKRPNAPVGR